MKDCYVALDIGAGRGTKIGLFTLDKEQISETLMPLQKYEKEFENFKNNIIENIEEATENGKKYKILSIGISAAGILNRDGSFQLFQNCPQYNGHNIKKSLEDALNVPVSIDNDANVGALAEWSLMKMELLYWVFGGGWGGAWIDRERAMYAFLLTTGMEKIAHFI